MLIKLSKIQPVVMLTLLIASLLLAGCSTDYINQNPTGQSFPVTQGQTLEQQQVTMPEHFKGEPTLLLIGYVQETQFDIDRWLIGIDMTGTEIAFYELPAIAGMFPRMLKDKIDNGMRKGIPKELWKGVITLYKDGEALQAFTGNQNPNNARVMLLDSNAKIVYFYDRGFSVSALNELREKIQQLK
jgi:hypothetical protein